MALDLEQLLIEASIRDMLKTITVKSNGVNDLEELRAIYATECAKLLIETIKRSTITINPGLIQVQGVGNAGAPVISTNSTPIVITDGIS